MNVPVRGIWNVTVTVDGEPIQQSTIAFPTSDNESRFGLPIRLTDGAHRIVVTASFTRAMTPPDANSRPVESYIGTTVTAALRFDEDGLPGPYEVSVTGTNPLDSDSDAKDTDVDEAGDGVVDGAQDFDGDHISTDVEREIGSNPLVADSDADGVPDKYEVVLIQTDPLVVDTDGDGVTDADEDADGDGFTNGEEVDVGTNLIYADTDADNLSDPDELALGTDPTKSDTDGDGLEDGVEPHAPHGTDPLDPDTDGDGIPDGAETVPTRIHNPGLGATVSIDGAASSSVDLHITSGASSIWFTSAVREASISAPVVLEATQLSDATLTLTVEVTGDGPFKIYRYNRTHQTYVWQPSTLNTDDGTIRAHVSQPGLYVAMNTTTWQSYFEGPPTG